MSSFFSNSRFFFHQLDVNLPETSGIAHTGSRRTSNCPQRNSNNNSTSLVSVLRLLPFLWPTVNEYKHSAEVPSILESKAQLHRLVNHNCSDVTKQITH